jgi:hypothetical protein
MSLEPASYPRHRFPAEIINHAVWLYHVFSLSRRDVELILAERGVVVTHESIRHWCLKFGGDFAARLRRRRPKPSDTWHLDEVFIRPGLKDGGQKLAHGILTSDSSGVPRYFARAATPEPALPTRYVQHGQGCRHES